MRTLIRNFLIVIAVIVIATISIIPPAKKLRLGKDLRGGATLVYAVQLRSTDRASEVIPQTIEVIKKRVNPEGLQDISIVQQGQDRIEITMALPTEEVKALKRAYEEEVAKLDESAIEPSRFERAMRTPEAERPAEIARLAAGDADRERLLREAVAAFEQAEATRQAYEKAVAEGAEEARLAELVDKAGDAADHYDKARQAVLRAGAPHGDAVRRIMRLSSQERKIRDAKTGQMEVLPSPRARAEERFKKEFPEAAAAFDRVNAANEAYLAKRTALDDAEDLKRLMRGAGVLDFRISVNPGQHPQEERLRREMRERGPESVRSTDARWYRVNKIDTWYDTTEGMRRLLADPAGFFSTVNGGFVGEEYDGEYYILCWDIEGKRLTREEAQRRGEWKVERAYAGVDQLGRPAIDFVMDPRGAVLLQELTRDNVGERMAVLLDDQVYTAPRLNSAIGKSGMIEGDFSPEELRYVIQVLAAGSLQAKLSAEPLSQDTLGPDLGLDNLRYGLKTGVICFIVVAIFMVVYYFTCGAIAVLALAINFLLVLAIMSLTNAAFTVPGIAGIVLTFGQAIDSNVLIYERMREEFLRGADMKTAVRLGFSRASSSIIDGNVANLIICVVLYYFGTQEIKGFAVTLGIGVVTTLFTAVFVSRVIFTFLVDIVGWRHASQLPMAFPFIQRLMTPHVDWMKWRWVNLGALTLFLAVSAVIWYQRGDKLLDTEFLGGTQVELQFKVDEKSGSPLMMARADVQKRVKAIAAAAPSDAPEKILDDAEVVPLNPQSDGVTSNRFRIKVGQTDEKVVLAALIHGFSDAVESRAALEFAGGAEPDWRKAPVFRVVGKSLGQNIDRPYTDDVTDYQGGVAILLDHITPPTTRAALVSRLDQMRRGAEFADTLSRKHEVRVVEGTDDQVTAAVVLVRDDVVNLFQNEDQWSSEMAAREWKLVVDALTHTTQLAGVQTFSPTIAAAFKAQAIVSIALSILLLTIYVWIRFGAGRWAIAATVPLFCDVIGIVGLVAVAQWLYENPATNGFATAIGLLPFKIDLDQIAALLTITGYSLNDKIIIMDRIRENKGKLHYASYKVINDSINQTLSRTIITAGTTLISTVILYFFGGEAVRGFAFAFTLGVLIGTYTSIVSSPLVWSRKAEESAQHPPRRSTPPATGLVTAASRS